MSSPTVHLVRVIGVVAVVAAVLTASAGVASTFARASGDTEFSETGVRTVQVTVAAGQVQLERAAGSAVKVEVRTRSTWRQPDLRRERDGDRLRLEAECGPGFGFSWCRVDYRIAVPDGVDLDLRVASGRVAGSDVDGDVRARVEAGEINLNDLRSTSVDATTEVGRVALHFADVPDDVRATASTGAVHVMLPPEGEPYAVSTRADVGDAQVSVATDPASRHVVDAGTSVGSVLVTTR